MTKRAGKRKHRMGSQKLPAAASPTPRALTLVEDHLPPAESSALELQAIAKGWLNEASDFDKVRQALISKIAKTALVSENPDLVIRSMRAIAQTEQRTKQLQLAAASLALRERQTLPEQLPGIPQAPEATAPHLVIQELIKRRDVRLALDDRSTDAPEPS